MYATILIVNSDDTEGVELAMEAPQVFIHDSKYYAIAYSRSICESTDPEDVMPDGTDIVDCTDLPTIH
ncbi:MAG: hypothetical protein ACOH2T_19200 [Pseudomonas sp.]